MIKGIRTPDNTVHDLFSKSTGGILRAVMDDEASTSTAFVLTSDKIDSLYDGLTIVTKNTKVASAYGCTINLNSLGAKSIWLSQTNAACTTHWGLNSTYIFIFDYTNDRWELQQGNDQFTEYYGTCTDTAATVAKTATLVNGDNFRLYTGVTVRIKFSNYNNATNPTLNVNSTGAVSIMRVGTTAVATSIQGSWDSGAVVTLTYDGTNWLLNDANDSSVGTAQSSAYAEGALTTSNSYGTHAEGYATQATGKYGSHSEGRGSQASGESSHAEGKSTTASGSRSHAEGDSTKASNSYSHAEGKSTTASGQASHSEGQSTTASGSYSHAEGYYTVANHESQHVFGEYNTLDASTAAAYARGNYVEIVGNGTADNARSNARTLDWNGNEVLAGGLTATTINNYTLGPACEKDIATSVTSGSTDLVTAGAVYTAIDNLPEPMVFKGSLGTGGTITALPVDGSAAVGDTYKVITAGTYAGQAADVGDTFICDSKTSDANTWTLIPSGDEPSGTVTSVTIQATSPIAIDSSAAITTSGTRTISHADSGVTAGTYKSVTVNATGHVTAGTNSTDVSYYGTCTDSASTVDKTATLTTGSNFTLTAGVTVKIKFSNYNEAANPTLNVNSTGAKAIMRCGTTPVSTSIQGSWDDGAIVTLTYDETNWVLADSNEGVVGTSQYAHAEGQLTVASGSASHAEGYGISDGEITASNDGAHAEGYAEQVAWSDTSQGTSGYNYLTVTASGKGSHAEGSGTLASGDYSHAEGNGVASLTSNSTYVNTASGKGSHVEGFSAYSNMGSGNYLYFYNTASGKGSHAEGMGTVASGDGSHAEGISRTTTSPLAVYYSTASGMGAHAEGQATTASGVCSHSEGQATTASGSGAHSEGTYSVASGLISHAEGRRTIANHCSQHVFGEYNVADTNASAATKRGDYVEIVGNGTAEDARSNARTLDWSGNEVLAGSVTANGGFIGDLTGNASSATNASTVNNLTVQTAVPANAVFTDTKNTAGNTDTSSKIYLVGATSQTGPSAQTYSQDTAYVGTDGHVYSNSKQVVNLSDTQALTNKTYNGYTLAAACAKAVVTSVDTSASLPTSNAVKTFVEGKGYVTTDTKNTTGSTDTSSKIYLVGATSQAANPQTYSDNEVYTTSGTLTTNKVQVGGGSCTLEYNSTTQSLDFVFT